jgi:hypothetical protein
MSADTPATSDADWRTMMMQGRLSISHDGAALTMP